MPARSASEKKPIRMTHTEYALTHRPTVLPPLPVGKLPTYAYLRAMMEEGAREAGKEFYDPIVEIVKLALTTKDERIALAANIHVSEKLYRKANDLSVTDDDRDNEEKLKRRRAIVEELAAAIAAKRASVTSQ